MNENDVDRVIQWAEENQTEDLARAYEASCDMAGAIEIHDDLTKITTPIILDLPGISYGKLGVARDVIFGLRDGLADEILKILNSHE